MNHKLECDNSHLQELPDTCCQRGAKMQVLYGMCKKLMFREQIPAEQWAKIIDWFDTDGVPK